MYLGIGMKHVYWNWDQRCVPGGPGGLPPASCDPCQRNGRVQWAPCRRHGSKAHEDWSHDVLVGVSLRFVQLHCCAFILWNKALNTNFPLQTSLNQRRNTLNSSTCYRQNPLFVICSKAAWVSSFRLLLSLVRCICSIWSVFHLPTLLIHWLVV